MKGLGFAESLATMPIGDARYADLAAGFLVIKEAAHVRQGHPYDHQATSYARRRVARITDLPVRALLFSILAGLREAASDRPAALDRGLVDYGILLHEGGSILAAVDAFAIVTEAHPVEPDTLLRAMHMRAYAYRMLQRPAAAEMAYQALGRVASQFASRHYILEADLGLAKLTIHRGDMPLAERLLGAVLDEAKRVNECEIAARAHIDLSCVAGIRHDYVSVIEHSYAALDGLVTRADSERAMRNLAEAFRDLGRYRSAIHLAELLARHAVDANERAGAATLRYRIALDVGDFSTAAALRTQIASQPLAPLALVEFFHVCARERALRQEFVASLHVMQQMLDLAEAHYLNEYIVTADRIIADLRARQLPEDFQFRAIEAQDGDADRLAPIEVAVSDFRDGSLTWQSGPRGIGADEAGAGGITAPARPVLVGR